MALKREMKITIGPGGAVNIEVVGVPGADCIDFTQFLEEELGEVVARERTPEYYQEQEQGAGQTLHVGGDAEDSGDA
jgi:hypothetical protein